MCGSSGPLSARRVATVLLASLACTLVVVDAAGATVLTPASGNVDLAAVDEFGASFKPGARSAALLGDVNGDGVGDLAIGVPTADPGGRTNAGSVYVVFGRRDGNGPVDLDALGDRGYRIDGSSRYGRLGASIAALGTVDGSGDTLADFAIGEPGGVVSGRGPAGVVWVVRGAGPPLRDIDLRSARDPRIVGLLGTAMHDETGRALAALPETSPGDPRGLIIGAPSADPAGRSLAGSVYVLPGPLPSKGNALLMTLAPTSYRIDGSAAGDKAGSAVASSPDISGDGLAEVLVGAPEFMATGPSAGAAYVVSSRPTGSGVDLAMPMGDGMTMLGAAGMRVGTSVLGPGDLSGDGVPDVVVGAPSASPGGRTSAGSVFMVRGKPASSLPVVLPGTQDVAIGVDGVRRYDRLGVALAPAGDLDRDGIADLLVAGPGVDAFARGNAGAVYVLRGRSLGAGLVNLALLGRNGVRLAGTGPSERSGAALAGGLDAGGDPRADVLVGGLSSAELLDAPQIPDPTPSIPSTDTPECSVTRDIELVVDDSGSMRSGDPQLTRQAAIQQMLSKPRSEDIRLGAIEIGRAAEEIFPPLAVAAAGFSDGRELAALRGLLAERIRNDAGATDYATGLLASVLHNPTAGAVLLITDGSEPASALPLPRPASRVYVLQLGTRRHPQSGPRLRELAFATRGRYFEAVDAESLPAALAIIEADLRCEQTLITQVAQPAGAAPDAAPAPPATLAPSRTTEAIAATTVAPRRPARFVTGLPAKTTAATMTMSLPAVPARRVKRLKNGRLAGTAASRCLDDALVGVRTLRFFDRRRLAVRATARQLRLAFMGHSTKIGPLFATGRCGRGYLTLRVTGLERIGSAGPGARAATDTPTRRCDFSTFMQRGKHRQHVRVAWTAGKRRGKRRR
jgi:hypothetical protein